MRDGEQVAALDKALQQHQVGTSQVRDGAAIYIDSRTKLTEALGL